MPVRKTPLATNHYYHLFNRSVAKVPIFISKSDFLRAIDLLNYYRFKNIPFPFSELKKLSRSQQINVLKELEEKDERLVSIICFCIMPNHFHLLAEQLQDDGILFFLRKFQNGYAKYFNIKYQRIGSLFQGRFKAVLIEDNNQLLHLNRYIHLNPYSSLVVKKKEEILFYQWSSLPLYSNEESDFCFCQTDVVLGQFKSKQNYLNFIFDQADYQRSLNQIKHLTYD